MKLKPCPWCGETPTVTGPDADGEYCVGCCNPECNANPVVYGDTPAEVIAAWNTRKGEAKP